MHLALMSNDLGTEEESPAPVLLCAVAYPSTIDALWILGPGCSTADSSAGSSRRFRDIRRLVMLSLHP